MVAVDKSGFHISNTYIGILTGLSRLSHVYAGTVPYKTIQQRRKKNRAAKRSRKINRR
ncbi:hypothetical protein SEA_DUSK_71 [Mycobacterium phage Dusk]|uniref:Uncharacterized protein n=1 Tax=Mycobacterium phage Dusk TaxID=1679524 RepID=A0A0H4THX8_9CAUD|nr:hypothetical protein SEA_DUSK_71 [Mycobacterium phage Dusk]AKQ08070.1 hypothetical protein SEA_DUSK_71 [Mycobacterium phage Dusk]